MKKIAVLTSGGDAPGMNAAIRSVVKAAAAKGIKVMGVERGYSGLISSELYEMDNDCVSDIIHKGGTILKTARCEEFKTEVGRKRAANVLKIFGVEGIVVIGGDGSFKGAQLLSKLGISTVGIPGTIDNDLSYTEYTIGFDTALNTAVDSIDKIRDTSTSHERVSIIEVMGRNCGDLALYSGIAGGVEQVIIPEVEFDIDAICEKILKGRYRGKKHNIIVLAEGVGGAQSLSKKIEELTGIETRSTILGYIQRGGKPSTFDRILATRMGYRAVEVLNEGKSSRVIGIKSNEIIDMDIDEALGMPKNFDEMICKMYEEISY